MGVGVHWVVVRGIESLGSEILLKEKKNDIFVFDSWDLVLTCS